MRKKLSGARRTLVRPPFRAWLRRGADLAAAVAAVPLIQRRGREAVRALAANLNRATDYETFCAAWLTDLAGVAAGVLKTARERRAARRAARRAMQRPGSWWRDAYAEVKVVEQVLLDSLDLLPAGQLDAGAMRRYNAYVKATQTVVPALGFTDTRYGGPFAMPLEGARVLPAESVMAGVARGHWVSAAGELWDVVMAQALPRLKRCPQCHRWFADESKNHVSVRCSNACTDKWWSRGRRRAAHHRSQGPAPRRQRRAR